MTVCGEHAWPAVLRVLARPDGTHVAGIVAAKANNTAGVAGVCPGCTLLDGKVLNDSGIGSSLALAKGINWAVK